MYKDINKILVIIVLQSIVEKLGKYMYIVDTVEVS